MINIGPQEPIRYRMLDTLRDFGTDCLAMAGELDAAQSRFTTWALGCAAWLADRFDSDDEPVADQRLRAELGNLHAAWRRLAKAGDLDKASELVERLYIGQNNAS